MPPGNWSYFGWSDQQRMYSGPFAPSDCHYHIIHHIVLDSSFFLFPVSCMHHLIYCCLQLNKFNNNRFFFFFIILINCDVFVLIPALFTFFSSILRLLLLLVTLDAFGICTKKSFPLEGACHSCKFLWFEECVLPRQCLSNQPLSFLKCLL